MVHSDEVAKALRCKLNVLLFLKCHMTSPVSPQSILSGHLWLGSSHSHGTHLLFCLALLRAVALTYIIHSFIHSFIHSLKNYSLNAYYISDIVLCCGDIIANKMGEIT